jgi:putative copper resistance protein D
MEGALAGWTSSLRSIRFLGVPVTAVALLAGNRFLQDTALALLWGGGGYVQFVTTGPLNGSLAASLRPAVSTAAVVVFLTAATSIPLVAASIGDGLNSLDARLISEVLTGTSVGHQLSLRLTTAAALAASVRLLSPRATVGTAGLLLFLLAFTGHGADATIPAQVIEALHILCGCAWLGALVPLVLTIKEVGGFQTQQATAALITFSRWGHLAVIGVLVCGSVTAWNTTGPQVSLYAPYDFLLLLKITVVGVMTALALANRYLIVPSIRRRPTSAMSMLTGLTVAEIALGSLALALVATFGLLDPH